MAEKDKAVDGDTLLDDLFAKIELEQQDLTIQTLKITRRAKHKHLQALQERDDTDAAKLEEYLKKPMATYSTNLRFFEVCTVSKWSKIEKEREAFLRERAVYAADVFTEGVLQCPLADRAVTTPKFTLNFFRMNGVFAGLLSTELFTTEASMEQFLMCTLNIRRIDPDRVLIGHLVLRLLECNGKWNPDNVEARVKFVDGICKHNGDALEVMKEKAVVRNFFFDVLNSPAALPLLMIEY